MIDYLNLSREQELLVLKATIYDNPYIPGDHMPFPKQIRALLDFRKELLFGGAAGGGKLIYTGTPIHTNIGIATIENLRVGDTVYDENGRPCYVLAVSDIETDRDCYKLIFSDGSELIAADTHLWPAVSINEESELKRCISKYNYLPPLENKTTKELYDTQKDTNYYIPVCKPLRFSKKNLILHPYVLGVWLGNGSNRTSRITGLDIEIFDENLGFDVHHYKDTKTHNVVRLISLIKKIGCYKNKHIPIEYFYASVKQRVDLLRGLMDSDGYATKNGGCEIQLTDKGLVNDISRLLHGLGIKHEIEEAKFYGKVTSKKWRIKFFTNIKVFNLKRKSDRQKRRDLQPTTFRRYIEKIEKIDPVPVKCIKVSSLSGQYLVGNSLIPTHNSDYLLMAALQFVTEPNYNAIIFRRSFTDLSLADGLIPRSTEWLYNTDAKWDAKTHSWRFPSGSTLAFGYLESETDIYRYKSSQWTFIGYEEVTEFPVSNYYTYLFSRLRKVKSTNIPLRMRATTNPDGPGQDWVYDRFQPEQPQPISPDRNFIQSKLADNLAIDRESYMANLDELDPVTRIQLRDGVWKVKKAGNKFKQEWFDRSWIDIDDIPQEGIVVRYWDLAATEQKKRGSKTTDPDFTVGARVRLHKNYYYIEDIRRGRFNPGNLEDFLVETAEMDGPGTIIYIEQEPGATGKIVIDDYIRRALSGYAVFGDRPTGSKEVRANVFSAALYNGMVRVARAPWNKQFVTECLLFPTKGVHDDQVDSVSGAIGKLPRAKRLQCGEIGQVETMNPFQTTDPDTITIEDILASI